MNSLALQHVNRNRTTLDFWQEFSNHRNNVTGLLRTKPSLTESQLCVLGAGNCNDLDLAVLLAFHHNVHLVDLDSEAVHAGIARQNLQNNSALHAHGGIDLSGMLDAMSSWSPSSTVPKDELTACIEKPAQTIPVMLPGPFHVVASTCVLSQMIDSLRAAVRENHAQFVELVQAVRAGHFRLLADLLAPGGIGILITDFVSSDTFPDLASIPDQALPNVLMGLIQNRNFFTGLNPFALESSLRADPQLSALVENARLVHFWRWNIRSRLYAVCALAFTKKSE